MTAQEKIWKVIRGLSSEFAIGDVMVLTGEKYSTISAYLSVLFRAGYTRKTGTRRTIRGRGESLYRLVKNTGPKPPLQRRCLYDPNIENLVEVKDVDVA